MPDPFVVAPVYLGAKAVSKVTGHNFSGKSSTDDPVRDRTNAFQAWLDSLSIGDLFARYEGEYEKGTKVDDIWSQEFDAGSLYDKENYKAYRDARDMLGREITANEYAMVQPYYSSRLGGNAAEGRAYLGNIARDEKEKADAEAAKPKAEDFYDSIGSVFQNQLGRDATEEERDHFAGMMAEEGVDSFELGRQLQQFPEFQEARDTEFREKFDLESAGSSERFFSEDVAPNILSLFQKSGRKHSTALDFAMTDALGEIEENRQNFLMNLSANQYGGRTGTARQDFMTQQGQRFGDIQYGRGQEQYGQQRQDYMGDVFMNRGFDIRDYQRQSDDYQRFLSSQKRGGRQKTPWYVPAAGVVGAGVGAATGNPWAAMAGYQIGQGTARAF